MTKIKFDVEGFDKLEKALKKGYNVRIGIMGNKANARSDAGANKKKKRQSLTNAEIGTFHEQPNNDGVKLPKRSFLEEPLKKNLYKFIEKQQNNISKSLENYQVDKVFQAIAIEGEAIVQEAFQTNGGNAGGWEPLSEAYRRRKKQSQDDILTLSGQLRRSITSKVVENPNIVNKE